MRTLQQLVDRLGKNKIYGHEKKGINCVRNVVLGNGRAQVKEQIQTLVGQVMRLAISQSPGFSRATHMLEGQEIWQHTFKLEV